MGDLEAGKDLRVLGVMGEHRALTGLLSTPIISLHSSGDRPRQPMREAMAVSVIFGTLLLAAPGVQAAGPLPADPTLPADLALLNSCAPDVEYRLEPEATGVPATLDFAGLLRGEWEPVQGEAWNATGRVGLLAPLLKPLPNTVVLGLSEAPVWLRIRVPDDAPYLVELEYPPLDYVSLYYVERKPGAGSKPVLRTQHAGDRLPYGASGVAHRNIVFALPAGLGGQCIFLRTQSESSLVLPLTLWLPVEFHEHTASELLVLGFYYGAVVIMLVYNLFLAISLRDASYWYYVGYIFAYGSYLLIWNGLALRLFWPEQPWLNSMLNPVMVCLSTALAALFSRSFFAASHLRAPVHIRLMELIAPCGFIMTALALFGFTKQVVAGSILLSGICVFIVLGFAVRQVLAGYRPARFFLLAFGVLGIGVFANILRTGGLLPANFFTLGYGLQASSLAEMVLLSFGLADRYRITENERRMARAESDAKTMFIARMSHEIRTPLNAMLGAAQMLEESELNSDQRGFMRMLSGGGRNLLAVVNDVLDLSRISSRGLELEERVFDLGDMCEQALRIHEPIAAQKQLQLRAEFSPHLPRYVRGDELRLSRVIVNLLSNALKFTKTGAVVLKVDLARKRGGQLQPGEQARLRFRCVDTGIGIRPDRLQNIFAAFSQADESVTRRFGGTGLGLAICHGILEQMGGTISVQSDPGRGSTFTVRVDLPVALAQVVPTPTAVGETASTPAATGSIEPSAAPADVRENPASTAESERGLRILLAEDNEDNRALFYAFLRRSAHNIDSVENGLEALHHFQE